MFINNTIRITNRLEKLLGLKKPLNLVYEVSSLIQFLRLRGIPESFINKHLYKLAFAIYNTHTRSDPRQLNHNCSHIFYLALQTALNPVAIK